ncbi:hypothetical protein EWM64_g10474 [Hericium alpestre]|uniref:Uncharacterized protein n=1 Tax=Hericium alpestre TaxID=135208 RepID=A0A4Y9ZII0_9AGAM|nr:hypothetical protein EWM64_g10474 [Hericium alpestre]
MSSHGDNPPPSSSFCNSFSPIAPPGQTTSPSCSSTPGPAKPPVPLYTRAQNHLHGITSSVQNGAFNATPSMELSLLCNKLFLLTHAWDSQYPAYPLNPLAPPSAPVDPMIVEPAPAPSPDPPAPAPISQMGPPLSYATVAASGVHSQPSCMPQPQGTKASASTPAGKSKKTKSPATRPAASAAPVLPTPSQLDPLARVTALAAAFPTAPATQLIQVARSMGPLYPTLSPPGPERPPGPAKPKVKHAPAAADADGLLVEFICWMPPSSFRVRFNKRPPPSLDNTFREFVLHYFTSPSNAVTVRATATRFQFRNTIFFRRIPLQNRDGSPVTSDALLQDLRKAPQWASINITSPPCIHTPKSARGFGVLYVDFADNAHGSVLQDVLKRSVLLHGESCWAQAAHSVKDYTVPCCTMCQKWGHRVNHCRSIYKRCAHCSGLHDERDHTSKAPCCSGTENVTCPHPATCANCRDAHRADSLECGFYKHRQDFPWIRSHQPGSHKPKSGMASMAPALQGKGKGKVGPSADVAMDEV